VLSILGVPSPLALDLDPFVIVVAAQIAIREWLA
jgi:hypothetical protein